MNKPHPHNSLVRDFRVFLGDTQMEFARRTGLASAMTVSKWERGKPSFRALVTCLSIAQKMESGGHQYASEWVAQFREALGNAAPEAIPEVLPTPGVQPRCGDCRHYVAVDKACRRFPPTVIMLRDSPVSWLPKADPDWWCGEFRPAVKS